MTLIHGETPQPAEERLLSWKRVKDLTGLSRTTAWREQKKGAFPAPVVISPGRVAWRERDITAWKAARAPRPEPQPQPCPSPRSFAHSEERPALVPPPVTSIPPTIVPPARRHSRARRASVAEQMRLDF